MRTLWLPYAQMQDALEPLAVVGGHGARLTLADGRELVDGVASWWAAIHGYGHPELVRAGAEQLEELPHVMLGGLVHERTQALADRLASLAPADLSHVFFGDSGSVGVEIALKMAMQYWRNRGQSGKSRVLAFGGAYHGDTLYAMSVCDPEDGMHRRFAGVIPAQVFAERPPAAEADVPAALSRLDHLMKKHAAELACVILEPLLQAAGGFLVHPPSFLAGVRDLCDAHDVLLVLDEVATGIGRTGSFLACEQASVCPDVLVLGKALTAGMVGHSATMARDRVYDAFLGTDEALAFQHGPTFMGNATACAIAMAGLDAFFAEDYLGKVARIEAQLSARLLSLAGPKIADTRVKGAMGVVEVHEPETLASLAQFALDRGVWLRPFGRYAYTMPPYVIADDELARLLDVFTEFFV